MLDAQAEARRRVGATVGGRFELLRLIDVGGMAAVYEASHRNGKRVAIKMLHPRLRVSERQRKRFLREAYIANAVQHPGVVPVHDDGLDGDDAYLVMELLEGETAAALQKRAGGKLPPHQVCHVAEALLDVLAAAHAAGVVHRDIKPSNLFIERSGRLRVLDFGVARFAHVPGTTVDTEAGAVLGTAAFMSQEQARGRWDEVDARSDVWAVGATLFTLLTGEFVHACDTANEQLGRAMTMSARSLASVAPDVPAGLTAVIDRALRFDRDERWPDVRSMQQALRALSASGTASAVAVDPRRPDRSAAPLASTASGSIAAPPVGRARSARVALMAVALGISIAATAGVHALLSSQAPSAAGRLQPSPVPARLERSPAAAASPSTKAMRADSTPVTRSAAARPAPVSDKPKTPPRVTRPRAERVDPAPRVAAGVNPFDLRY